MSVQRRIWFQPDSGFPGGEASASSDSGLAAEWVTMKTAIAAPQGEFARTELAERSGVFGARLKETRCSDP